MRRHGGTWREWPWRVLALVALVILAAVAGLTLAGWWPRSSPPALSLSARQVHEDARSGVVYPVCVPERADVAKNGSWSVLVVLPFPPRQIAAARAAVQQWTTAGQCDRSRGSERGMVDLLLWCSGSASNTSLVEEVRRLREESRSAWRELGEHAGTVHAALANLTHTQDLYYYSWWRMRHVSPGTTHLFYAMFTAAAASTDPAPSALPKWTSPTAYPYAVWLEPDTWVVQPCLLESLLRLIDRHHPFWVLGSAPQYRRRGGWVHVPHDHHLNGNAVYRLNDRCFSQVLLQEVFARYPDTPFDGALQRWRYARTQDAWWRAYAHMFGYTDWVRNYGRRAWCAERVRRYSPGTCVVHGRHRRERCGMAGAERASVDATTSHEL
ncbi:hypothetical protein CDCA_CDCA20G4838 [Cyanidium caldarium]|uniref:Hexosyltransferase n=1 Tax=Cyanidium caldarium TaxID=2771 RepID=A0AAV9J2J6_CYACA|nr:hypothetical protein CDCA_CDCA20G4838 [Cyanidium caldarium]